MGIATKTIQVNRQFSLSIKPRITTIFSKSLPIIKRPWLKILAIDSMSETERVINCPTGAVS